MRTFGGCTHAYYRDGNKLVPCTVIGVSVECEGTDRAGGAYDLSAQLDATSGEHRAGSIVYGSARDFPPRSMVSAREGGGVIIERAYRWVKGI